MTIRWNIRKQRGNTRPKLTVCMELTKNERDLCVPVVRMEDGIPKPPDAGWSFCLPGENERTGKWEPSVYHCLQTPHHKDGKAEQQFTLPWRENNDYPEVDSALKALRERFEIGVREANSSAPMDICGELETSARTKEQLAPNLAADRILQLVGAG